MNREVQNLGNRKSHCGELLLELPKTVGPTAATTATGPYQPVEWLMSDLTNTPIVSPAQAIMAPFDTRAFVKRVILAAIRGAGDDPSEMKHRIMVAREHGHLTDEETEFYIAAWGLVEA